MKHGRSLHHLVLVIVLLCGMLPLGPPLQTAAAPTFAEVESELQAQIQVKGSAGYLIYFREQADLSPAHAMDWEARGRFVVESLQKTAERSQRSVRAYLDAQGAEYQAFWIDNVIVVEASTLATFNALTTSFPEITALRARRHPILYEPQEATPERILTAIESNLTHIKADQVWGLGHAGEGIIVANIDTGVRYTHAALVNQYRGNLGGGSFDHNHSWWDPYVATTAPEDVHDHGSHTIGTIVGDDGGTNQIGMAPSARWIACKGFNPGATDAGLLSCGQFLAAPWDLSGNNANPDLRPHVVNNSWGDCGQSYDPWYAGVLTAWHAAGIYPVFSNGNAGNCSYSNPPGLNTVGNPARSGNVTGVGSTGRSNGQYAVYSNWGPTDNLDTVNPRGYAYLKPQVVAPGTNRSAGRSSDTDYRDMTGTSMAGPHVAGLIALMWSAAPCLVGDYATTETLIEETAIPIPYASGGSPAPGPGNVPNYATGWGEIDALAAVEAAVDSCGDSILTGEVMDDTTGAPIAGALVEATAGLAQTYTTRANPSGIYTLNVFSGTYALTISAFGYQPVVISDVQASSGITVTQDVVMTSATWYTITGAVTDSATGWPLYAIIDIDGYPGDAIWTNPVTGEYSISLPEGIETTFNTSAWVAGYTPAAITVGPLTADDVVDIPLDANLELCQAPGYARSEWVPSHTEDFEANDGGYVVSGNPADHWQWGTPSVWPNSCASGDRCWGTNLSGNYANNANTVLTSPVIDLSGESAPLTANWWQAWHIESAIWDHGYAEVSINGGAWQYMWYHTGGTTQIDWTEMSYDISAAAGGNVQFRFRLTSDGSVNLAGYYLDQISISGASCQIPVDGGLVVGNVYDFETGDPLVGAHVENGAGEAILTEATPADPAVDDGFYTLFSPSGAQVFTATMARYSPSSDTVNVATGGTVQQDFALDWFYPVVTSDPAELDVEVPINTQLTTAFGLLNTGTAATDFEIREKDRGFTPTAGEDILVVRWETANADAMQATLTALGRSFLPVTDAVFRAMSLAELLEYQAVFYAGAAPVDSLPQLTAYLDAGGALFIADNDLGFFRGTTPFYQTYLQASYNADDGGNFLTGEDLMAGLDLDISADPFPDDFIVGPEGVRIFKYTTSDFAGGVAVDREGYRAIYLAFDFHRVAGAANQEALLERILDFLTTSDVPWIATDPITGTLAANTGSVVVDVVFDAAQVEEPGQYQVELQVRTEDPTSPLIVPVTMNVTAPGWGKIEGTVTSLGYCDENPAFVEGAEVLIESRTGITWTRVTDENGWYALWVEPHHGPLTISVVAGGHEYDGLAGIPLVADEVSYADFDLRWSHACGGVDPTALHVTLSSGESRTLPLTLSNDGSLPMAFTISEISGTVSIMGPPAPSVSETGISTTPQQVESGAPTRRAVIGTPSGGPAPEEIGDAWETVAPLPAGRVFNAVIADDSGYIYVIGGTSDAGGSTPTNTTYRYDTATDSWDTMTPIPAPLNSIDGIFIYGRIFIPGDATTANTFVYDIASDSWSTITANGGYTARSQYQVVAIDTDLYVLGGIVAAGSASTTEVWILDTTTGTWSTGVPMQRTRTSFSAAAIDGQIYAAGGVAFPGFVPDMTAEKFNGTAWSYIAGVPAGGGAYTRWSYNADGHGADGLWLAAGRRDTDWSVLNHAAYYDPETDTWTDSPTIPTLAQGRVYMEGAVAADGYFYVIGGRDGAGITVYSTNERLYVGYAGAPPVDIPWVSQDPVSGTVAADSTGVVDITLTAFPTMTLGTTYTATLVIRINDPATPRIYVPVTMTILPPSYELTINVAGDGSGVVTPPAGTHTYLEGQAVTVSAAPDPGSIFTGWTGDVIAASPSIVIDIRSDTVITATFEAIAYTLDVNIVGEGTVAVEPDRAEYRYGDIVTLTATAGEGWTFIGWSGDATATNEQLVLTILEDTVVTAMFRGPTRVFLPLMRKR